MNSAEILQALTDAYHAQMSPDDELTVQFEIEGEGTWHVMFGGEAPPEVQPGARLDALFIFALAPETLARLYNGDLAPLTAAGRAHISESAPLDFRLREDLSLTHDVYVDLVTFMQRFFNPSTPERVELDEEHARKIHGGNAVALFYGSGFRSAWYLLRKGERLNAPEDTNPFPQAFIFLSGQGRAQIGEETVTVRASEAYYIPPHQKHVVWNERDEPLTLIFLAWGEGS